MKNESMFVIRKAVYDNHERFERMGWNTFKFTVWPVFYGTIKSLIGMCIELDKTGFIVPTWAKNELFILCGMEWLDIKRLFNEP